MADSSDKKMSSGLIFTGGLVSGLILGVGGTLAYQEMTREQEAAAKDATKPATT